MTFLSSACLMNINFHYLLVLIHCLSRVESIIQLKPLKPIVTGRGACNTNAEGESKDACGGPNRGRCTTRRVCSCEEGWTGPHCLVQVAYDPIMYEREDEFHDLEFALPEINIKGIWTGLIMGLVGLSIFAFPVIRRRLDGWKPLRNDEL